MRSSVAHFEFDDVLFFSRSLSLSVSLSLSLCLSVSLSLLLSSPSLSLSFSGREILGPFRTILPLTISFGAGPFERLLCMWIIQLFKSILVQTSLRVVYVVCLHLILSSTDWPVVLSQVSRLHVILN